MKHVPVLLQEVLEAFRGLRASPRCGLDVTFGRGGHTRALLAEFPQLQMTAIDRDEAALAFGRESFASELAVGRLRLEHRNFHRDLPAPPTGFEGWDLVLADLGVSSPQLDEAERGFSFYQSGPLDMRMDRSQGSTAQDIVNHWQPEELLVLFREYGEIRRPQRVVDRIVEQRRQAPITTTGQLAQLIERAEGWGKKGHHPATRYFLALRLEVNEELSALRPALENMMRSLALGGRLAVITFHSLEDRIVKYAFKESSALGFAVNKKVIVPSREECRVNPRSRSAKLRIFEKGPRP